MDPKQYREERKNCLLDAQRIADAAEAEGRAMTSEEAQRFDAAIAKADDLLTKAETAERIEKVRGLVTPVERSIVTPTISTRSRITGDDYANAFRAFTTANKRSLQRPEYFRAAEALGIDPRDNEFVINLRALSGVTNTAGEYTIGEQWGNYVDTKLQAYAGVRQVAQVLRTESGETFHLPTCDDVSNVGALIAENTAAGEQDLAFGEKTLGAYKYTSKYVKVPQELIQDSRVNVVQYVVDRLMERIGRAVAAAYTTADGSSKPQGIIGAATAGVTLSAGEDAITDITLDHFVDLVHSVDPAYRASDRCAFMFSDAVLAYLKKKTNATTNAMLWTPSYRDGEPDRFMGFRYIVNNNMPAIAADGCAALFGDFSHFWIRDVGELRMRRLDELNALSDQVTFVGFFRTDSELMSAGAPIKKLVMGSAA